MFFKFEFLTSGAERAKQGMDGIVEHQIQGWLCSWDAVAIVNQFLEKSLQS